MKKIIVVFACSIIVLFAVGCGGPSSEVLAVTMVAQTDVAATQTRAAIPTDTPTPTNTPTLTDIPTPTFTSTPIPEPDAAATLDWKSLQIPSTFKAFSPESIGIGKGAEAFSVLLNGIPKTYMIEKGFAFRNEDDSERIYGYTALFETSQDREIFDMVSKQLGDGMPLRDIEKLSIGRIGTSAAGITGIRKSGWRLDHIQFRIGVIGVFVFSQYPNGDTPSVTVEDLAKVYSDSISNPIPHCSLVTITSTGDVNWPYYDVEAEGFFPGEAYVTLLEGELQLDGDPVHAAQAFGLGDIPEALFLIEDKLLDFGFDMFTFDQNLRYADSEGQVTDSILLPIIDGVEVTFPDELTSYVFGLYSGCEIVQKISWSDFLTTTPAHATVNTPEPVANTPVPGKIAVSTPTPKTQQYFTEEFNEDLVGWSTFSVDTTFIYGAGFGVPYIGDLFMTGNVPSRVGQSLTVENGFLIFNNSLTESIYAIYEPFEYEEIRIETRFENKGSNMNATGLICNYTEDVGWYEISISQATNILIQFAKIKENGGLNYYPVPFEVRDEGSYTVNNAGVNEMTVICHGNSITTFVNGSLALKGEVSHANFLLDSGKVGVVVASNNQLPVAVDFDWVKISQP